MDDGERSAGDTAGADASAAAGVDHLQAAGREFLAAARSFLDAVESVVEDRSRLGELAESFTGFVGELVETARGGDRTPWGQAVRFGDSPPSGPPAEGVTADQVRVEPESVEREHLEGGGEVAGGDASVADVSSDDSGGSDTAAPSTGRVRRIPVD